MTIAGATIQFLASQHDSTDPQQPRAASYNQALTLLAEYFGADAEIRGITSSRLRDFISRWYVEEACASKISGSKHAQRGFSPANQQALSPERATDRVPKPEDLLDSLSAFFEWAEREAGTSHGTQCSAILNEMRHSLARALEIAHSLSRSLRERGGAFNFPEFLTSFEEGGSSQYDIDVPGHLGAIDGYFRIVRVEGSTVEAEELISEERVWPIVFPSEISALLDDAYIVNLELVRVAGVWEIAGCGFAYPPGTQI